MEDLHCVDDSVCKPTGVAARLMKSDSIGSSPDVSVHDPDDNEASICMKEDGENHSEEGSLEEVDTLLEYALQEAMLEEHSLQEETLKEDDSLLEYALQEALHEEEALLENTLEEETLLEGILEEDEDTLLADTPQEDTLQGHRAYLFQGNEFKSEGGRNISGDSLCDLASRKRPLKIDNGCTPKFRKISEVNLNVQDKDTLSPVPVADISAGAKHFCAEPYSDTPEIVSKFQFPSKKINEFSSTPIANKDCQNNKHVARKFHWDSSLSSCTDAELSAITQYQKLDQMTVDDLIAEITSILDENDVNKVDIDNSLNKVDIETILSGRLDESIDSSNIVSNNETIIENNINKDDIDRDNSTTVLDENRTVETEESATPTHSNINKVESSIDDNSDVNMSVRRGRFKDVVATISIMATENDDIEVTKDFLGLDSDQDEFLIEDEINISVRKCEDHNSLMEKVRNTWQSNSIDRPREETNLTISTTKRKKMLQKGENFVGILENDKLCSLNLLEFQRSSETVTEDRRDIEQKTLERLYRQKECLDHMKLTGIATLREGLTARTDQMLERHKDEMNHLMTRQKRNKAGDKVSKQLMERLSIHHGREYSALCTMLNNFIKREAEKMAQKLEPVDLLIKQLEEQMCHNPAGMSGACGPNSVDVAGDTTCSSMGVNDGRYGPMVTVTLKMGPNMENRGCASGVTVCLPAVIAQMVSQEDDIYDHYYRY